MAKRNVSVSPNQVLLDGIPNEHIVAIHMALDKLRAKYGVRLRIKADGRSTSPARDLPTVAECEYPAV